MALGLQKDLGFTKDFFKVFSLQEVYKIMSKFQGPLKINILIFVTFAKI